MIVKAIREKVPPVKEVVISLTPDEARDLVNFIIEHSHCGIMRRFSGYPRSRERSMEQFARDISDAFNRVTEV